MRTSQLRAPISGGAFATFFALIASGLMFLSGVAQAAPTISGTPKTTFGVNGWYSFTPTARDPAVPASSLRYSIVNKPAWAKFSTTTGKLEGATPTSPGTWSNIRISVRSSTGTAALPAFSIATYRSGGGSTPTNRPPVVSGTPSRSIVYGNAYSFRPTGSDPEGRALTWSITNRPSWAAFNTSTGALTGTPSASHVGTYSNIGISASDGTNRTSLAAFSIAVNSPGTSTGSATLSWTPPTTNTNGSSLSNLAGYRIYYGTSPSSLTRTVQVSGAGMTRYVISDLSPATYYFSVRAYTSTGSESVNSNTVSKVVR